MATDAAPLQDTDRQAVAPSLPALDIFRGVIRMFHGLHHASVTEMTLANGRRADVLGLGAAGEIVIAEVKSCLNDFRTDAKWPDYAPFCDRFYFAVSHDFPTAVIPESAGLIIADRFGGAIVREAPEHKLSAARRKAVTLRFARLAAQRLNLEDLSSMDGGPLFP
ncbi:MAG: MmcB family DNA repair protein [Pseudomonadota bacterium]